MPTQGCEAGPALLAEPPSPSAPLHLCPSVLAGCWQALGLRLDCLGMGPLGSRVWGGQVKGAQDRTPLWDQRPSLPPFPVTAASFLPAAPWQGTSQG